MPHIKFIRALLGAVAVWSTCVAAQQDHLPDFGEGNAVSLSQEYLLGRAWLMSFRRQAPILSDPQMQDYIESLVFRLAETSQLRERRLEIVLVNHKSINAFAVPGGVVGVHNGLILAAESEAQLASVLGHELAHLSQRHFSRGVENSQKTSKMAMVGLLGWAPRRQRKTPHYATAVCTSRRRTAWGCKTSWRLAWTPTAPRECS
jgi:predicted Zn-dependent protease